METGGVRQASAPTLARLRAGRLHGARRRPGGAGARRPGRAPHLGAGGQARIRDGHPAAEQRVVHVARRRADGDLLPGPEHAELPRPRVRGDRRQEVPGPRDRRARPVGGAAAGRVADLPADDADRALAPRQDLGHRSRSRDRAGEGALRVPDPQAAAGVPAGRPGARRRWQRRPRQRPGLRAARLGRQGGERRGRRAAPAAGDERIRRLGERSPPRSRSRQVARRSLHRSVAGQRRAGGAHAADGPQGPAGDDARDRVRGRHGRGAAGRRSARWPPGSGTRPPTTPRAGRATSGRWRIRPRACAETGTANSSTTSR